MEISNHCFRCADFINKNCTHVNDMANIKPLCFKEKKCGTCCYSEKIEGKNEMVGCTKLKILRNYYSTCEWNG